uniref:TNFR-Cys domain-containing protein n=1 Tax=Arion vulgaris TaxID=1028688 RepID=A0A0B6Z2S4_9EUPU
MKEMILMFLILLPHLPLTASVHTCPPGHRLHSLRSSSDICVPCEDGSSFISESNHFRRKCHACTEIGNPELEISITACNRTQDTKIRCRDGYYMNKSKDIREKGKCEKCRECEFYARVCHGEFDAVCCLNVQNSTVIQKDMINCNDVLVMCGLGHYLASDLNTCVPCSEGRFMNVDNHTNKDCWKCHTLSEKETSHAVIVKPCSKSSPTLFGCEGGYTRNNTEVPLEFEVLCLPCQNCIDDTRKRDQNMDNCCINSGYSASGGSGLDLQSSTEGQAVDELLLPDKQNRYVCEIGFYLHTNISDGSSTCIPCLNNIGNFYKDCTEENIAQPSSKYPTKTTANNGVFSDFRIYIIILLSMVMLVDIVYVILYRRHFIRNSSRRLHRRCSSRTEKTYRV